MTKNNKMAEKSEFSKSLQNWDKNSTAYLDQNMSEVKELLKIAVKMLRK